MQVTYQQHPPYHKNTVFSFNPQSDVLKLSLCVEFGEGWYFIFYLAQHNHIKVTIKLVVNRILINDWDPI